MKHYAVIIACLALNAGIALSQNQSASQAGDSRTQSGATAQPQTPQPGQVPPPVGNSGATGTIGGQSDASQNSSINSSTATDAAGANRSLGTPPLTSSGTNRTSTSGAYSSQTGTTQSTTQPGTTSSSSTLGAGSSTSTSSSRAGGSILTDPAGAGTTATTPETATDRALSDRLRQTISSQSSATAGTESNMKNVKITSHNGAVTLRGNVKTEGEKRSIEMRLKNIDGVVSIDNQLTVGSRNAATQSDSDSATSSSSSQTQQGRSSIQTSPGTQSGASQTDRNSDSSKRNQN